MSLQAILERIRAAGDLQRTAIQTTSEKEIQVIFNNARTEAARLHQHGFQQALEPEAGERAAILNQARFEAVCILGSARDELVSAALAEVVQMLKASRSSQEYPAVLERILVELLPGTNGTMILEDMLILEADIRDKELLEGILRRKQLALRVEYSLSCWGGLCGQSPDGTIRIVNTLESRLERALPFIKTGLTEWFDQKSNGLQEGQKLEEKPAA